MLRALVISPQPFFSPRGTPLSVYYRNQVMAEMGVQIDLVTYGQGEDVDIPGMRIFRIPDFPRLGKIKAGPTFLKAFLDIFIFAQTLLLLRRHRYDFVHVHEEAVFLCLPLKKLFKFRMLYDMHSSLPQQLENFNFTRSRLIRWVFQWLEDRSLEASDAVITICPSLADYTLNKLREPWKHHLIENSIFRPVKLIRPTTPQTPLGKLPPSTVVYCGTLEHYQGIDILLEAFKSLARQVPEARLLIIGGDDCQCDRFQRMAAEIGLSERVRFTGVVPQSEAHHWMAQAAVLVSPRRVGINTPLKVYQLLASGVPVVATDIPAHTQVLNPRVAFLVRPDSGSLAEGMRLALTDKSASKQKTQAAQDLYQTEYSESSYRKKLAHLLGQLTGRIMEPRLAPTEQIYSSVS